MNTNSHRSAGGTGPSVVLDYDAGARDHKIGGNPRLNYGPCVKLHHLRMTLMVSIA